MREEISLRTERHLNTSVHRYSSQNCDSPEITIEFHSFLLPHLPPPPYLLSPSLSNPLFLILSLSL